MILVFLIIICTIVFIAFALLKQIFEIQKLKKEILQLGSLKIILSKDEINFNPEDYSLLLIDEHDLINPKSFTRRIMRKCGKQKLPFVFWLDEQNNIHSENF